MEAVTVVAPTGLPGGGARLYRAARRLRGGAVPAAAGVACALAAACLAVLAAAVASVALFATLERALGLPGALWSATGLLATLAVLAATAARRAARG